MRDGVRASLTVGAYVEVCFIYSAFVVGVGFVCIGVESELPFQKMSSQSLSHHFFINYLLIGVAILTKIVNSLTKVVNRVGINKNSSYSATLL